MESGNLKLDIDTRTVYLDDEEASCSNLEFDILAALIEHKGQFLTPEWLLENVVGGDNIKSVHVHIRWLRSKIEPNVPHTRIITVRGIGYRFDS